MKTCLCSKSWEKTIELVVKERRRNHTQLIGLIPLSRSREMCTQRERNFEREQKKEGYSGHWESKNCQGQCHAQLGGAQHLRFAASASFSGSAFCLCILNTRNVNPNSCPWPLPFASHSAHWQSPPWPPIRLCACQATLFGPSCFVFHFSLLRSCCLCCCRMQQLVFQLSPASLARAGKLKTLYLPFFIQTVSEPASWVRGLFLGGSSGGAEVANWRKNWGKLKTESKTKR